MKIRLGYTLIVAIVLALLITVLAPQQIPITAYKLLLITAAAFSGYYIDRALFPYSRPDGYLVLADEDRHEPVVGVIHDADYRVNSGYELVFAAAMLRRAIVVAACVVGVALGA
jgi:hypothetical protein